MGPGTEIVGGRSRKDVDTTAARTPPSSSIQTSLRLVTDHELRQDEKDTPDIGANSTYGVQSLQDSRCDGSLDTPDTRHHLHAKEEDDHDAENRPRSTSKPASKAPPGSGTIDDTLPAPLTADSSPLRLPPLSQVSSIAHSLTSLSLDSLAPSSSLPSSPKSTSHQSFRPSDEESLDEAATQAIASSSEDEVRLSAEIQDSAPQLIMPSIKMPSRRPFTERGAAIGRLKILIAGDSGAGKTSLIKSIVQNCEDIVHVDPTSSSTSSMDRFASGSPSSKCASSRRATHGISEVYASTRPYPSWWSITESTMLLRRKKVGDSVLERNICFVDTPGYSSGMSRMEVIDKTLQYVGDQVKRSFSDSPGEGDIVGLLGGSGGSQVDLVFYLIAQNIKQEDIIFLQRLNALSNVIILISKSDDRSVEETEIIRQSISDQLHVSDIRLFQFPRDNARQPPFTVCSTPFEDEDNMDASLLMSSQYVKPLIPSELECLIDQIFGEETAMCLRHLAATKVVQVQRRLSSTKSPSVAQGFSNSLSPSTGSFISPSFQAMVTQGSPSLTSYTQAKITDHTQYEEKVAQVRLAKWAADLRRSLQNERQRYEALAQGERAVWLSQKLEEITRDGFPVESGPVGRSGKRHRRQRVGVAYDSHGWMNADDPLGLLRWNELMVQRGWVALQVAGGFGVLGAVAVWIARSWSSPEGEWDWSWWRST